MDEYWATKLKQLFVVLLIAGLVWVGGWGMYHIKILSAISAINDTSHMQLGKLPPFQYSQESVSVLSDCGTRALPYLANSMDPKRQLPYLILASEWLRKYLEPEGKPQTLKKFTLDETESSLDAKCKEYRAAWARLGAPKHQWWKWWKAEDLPPQINPDDYFRP